MRVRVVGDKAGDVALIAAALEQGGITLALADAPFDLLLTLHDPGERLTLGDLVIDLALRRAALAGVPLALTQIEYALLAALAAQDRPIGRTELLRAVWGYRFDPGTNLVAVHIFRLRAKIGRDRLRGGPEGYVLVR